jgi:hypothetical protein
MNKKAQDAVKKYNDACNLLASMVNEQLFDGCRKWYWIGDEVGGVCDFEETDVLNPEDMVRIIENGMSYDEYAEWRDANLDNNRYINLKSWLMGLRHDMLKEEVKENMKPILDCCCGSRMFYFDKKDPNVLFADIREVHEELCDGRLLDVNPDVFADCTNMPFTDGSFRVVVFDPPHLKNVGLNSWLCKKYGILPDNWQEFINDSIHECMRVLADYGVLIFKWNEQQIKVSEILGAIKDYKPIFGHRTTSKNATIWMAFMKHPKYK